MGALGTDVYPDTCILIYLVENHPGFVGTIAQKMRGSAGHAPTLVFTELTRLECRVKPLKTGNTLQLAGYERIFAMPSYRFVSLTKAVFDLATELRAQHGLKTPDALHLAAAISAGCDEFWTNDLRLTQAAQGRIRTIALCASIAP